MRLQPLELAALDAWIARQPDRPSRPEALRRLARFALDLTDPDRRIETAPVAAE